MGRGVSSVLVPGECLLCGELLPSPLVRPICPECVARLPRIEEPYCPRCGLPYAPSVAAGLCGPCRSPRRGFRRARAALPYEGDVRRLLHALKFAGRERVAGVLGELACAMWIGPGKLDGYAAVVPVPLSRKRRRERGFNQAERIGRVVARGAGLPLVTRILLKARDCPPQAGLSASARRKNVAGVYRASLPRALRGADVLLVDDVLTTGATAGAAARALLGGGARAVDVLTLARVP